MNIKKTTGLPINSGIQQTNNSNPAPAPAENAVEPQQPKESVVFSDPKEPEGPRTLIGKVLSSPVGRVATGVALGGATGLATGAAGGNPVVAKAISATVGGGVGVVAGAGLGFIVSLPFALAKNSSKPMSIGAGVGALGGGAVGVAGGLARGEMIAAFGSYLGGGIVGHTAAGALIGGGAALLTL